jgi:hypothetical protein
VDPIAASWTTGSTGPALSAMQRLRVMRTWSGQSWVVATLAAAAATLLIAVPTGIIRTPWYTRMTPVQWWNYSVLAASALLLGLTAATYARPAAASAHAGAAAKASGGGVLSVFAVGCPSCNKLVVLALGASGALRYFAPVQPLLAVVSLGLLLAALWVRFGGQVACRAASA